MAKQHFGVAFPREIKTQIPHGHVIPVFSLEETHSHCPGHPQEPRLSHGMGRGKCVPKGWHIPEGLIRVTVPALGLLSRDQTLLKGDSWKFPALGIPMSLSLFDGGDGAC